MLSGNLINFITQSVEFSEFINVKVHCTCNFQAITNSILLKTNVISVFLTNSTGLTLGLTNLIYLNHILC